MPDPISGKAYMTSTQAKLIRLDQSQLAREPALIPPQHNPKAPEPKYAFPFHTKEANWPNVGVREDSFVQTNSDIKWQVLPDLGELDDHSTLYREFDSPDFLKGKAKEHGWTNPLGW